MEVGFVLLVSLDSGFQLLLQGVDLLIPLGQPLGAGAGQVLALQPKLLALAPGVGECGFQGADLLAEVGLELGALGSGGFQLLFQLPGTVLANGDPPLQSRDRSFALLLRLLQLFRLRPVIRLPLGISGVALGDRPRQIGPDRPQLIAELFNRQVALLDGLIERLLLDLELQRGDPELFFELLEAGPGCFHLGAALAKLLVPRGNLLAKDVDFLLLRGYHFDQIFFGGELLQQQVVDGGAVLALFVHHALLRLIEAPEQIIHLHLQTLQLDILFVNPVLHREQLPLPDSPDLRNAR